MTLIKKGLVRGVTWFSMFGLLTVFQWGSGNVEGVHRMLVYGGIAFFLGGTSVIYEVRRWSFPKQILIHWSTMHVTILPFLLLSSSVQVKSWQDFLSLYAEFNVSGLILFSLSYALLKLRRRVNAS